MKALEHWYELNALRGWSPRARWLMGLEDTYRGNLYASLRYVYERSDGSYAGLADWSPSRTSSGCYIPASQRQPGIQAGALSDKVDRLVQLLVGEERGVVVKLTNNADQTSTDNADLEELRRVLDEDVQLWHLLQLPVLDLVVKGSGCFGFARPDPDGPFLGVYLGTEWCDVVFASQVKNAKARKLAEGLAMIPEMQQHLAQDDDGWHLVAPEGAKPLDLAFLRYQYRWDEEVPIQENGTATKTVINWIRRDYLPNVIAEYKPQHLEEDQSPPLEFTFIPEASKPHNWGVLPLVWVVPPGTIPGEMDGESLLTRPVRDMAAAMDYALSHIGDSHAFNASGLLTIINAMVRGRPADQQNQGTPGSADIPTDAGGVLHLMGDGADAKLLETSGQAITTGLELLKELDRMIQARTGMVEPPAEQAGGVMSGVALERMMERLIGKVNAYRRPVGHAVRTFIRKLITVVEAVSLLRGMGEGARAMIEWPKLVEQTAEDVQAWATAFGSALAQGLLPKAEAVRQFAQKIAYDGDPEELVKAVEQEAEEAVAAAMRIAQQGPAGDTPPEDEEDPTPPDEDPEDT